MLSRFKYRYRSVLIVLLTVVLFCLPAATGLAAVKLTGSVTQQTGVPAVEVTNQVGSYLNDFIAKDTALRNWKLLDQKVTVVSSNQSGYEVSMVFDVDRKHLLDFAKAEDIPALKGRLAYIQKNGKQLSANGLTKANKEIENWKHDLNEYITIPQNCFDRIKVTAVLDIAGLVKPETVSFYREDPLGNFVTTSLQDIPSNATVEQASFDTIKANVSAVSNKSAKTVQPMAIVNYNRLAARDYVQLYTSNTSLTCSGGSALQNTSYYNLASYSYYNCNDCANFVSQGLRAGGIATDGTWYKDSSAWIGVSALTSYMVGRTYWIESTNINDCVAGMPLRMKTGSHVMMMSYNDGSTRKYCAHTNDRKDASWTGGTADAYYYRINY
ncbi:MAG: amidase domain-containing protein [Eubacteriales bacterium]